MLADISPAPGRLQNKADAQQAKMALANSVMLHTNMPRLPANGMSQPHLHMLFPYWVSSERQKIGGRLTYPTPTPATDWT